MKQYNWLFFILLAGLFACQPQQKQQTTTTTDYTQWVNPFIGTGGHGHTYPGAATPFGMVQLSPDNGTEGWDWCSGYNYQDTLIAGFSHQHLSGTGVGDLYDVLFMPAIGPLNFPATYQRTSELQYLPGSRLSEPMPYWSTFSHTHEQAEPGYYQVLLQDFAITAELTATARAGMQRYTFPASEQARVVVDLGHSLNWDYPGDTHFEVVDSVTIRGYRHSSGWAKKQSVYFYSQLSRPFEQATLIAAGQPLGETKATGEKLKLVLNYTTDPGDTLLVKTGISAVSMNNARANLEQEIAGWAFNNIRRQAKAAWNEQLGKIEAKALTEDEQVIFYTSLYHSMLAPMLFTDANGQYRGADGQVHTADDYQQYTVFSLWDTFRATHPLYHFMHPEKTADFIRSMLAHYDETGALPMWPLVGNETYGMIGYHAVSVIAEAYVKGYRNFDVEKAFEAMKATAMQDTFGLRLLREKGYMPADSVNYSVSRTLEYAYNDWCIAQMAQALGKTNEYHTFMQRAAAWKNVWDASTGFMRGKLANGQWLSPFDPLYSDHFQHPYIEGNAWQYSWFVPHDVYGLIAAHGGHKAFLNRLDSLFVAGQPVKGQKQSVDITGLIGQYAHGNEPSHHVAYLFNYAGAPWKTQEKVHEIMHTQYANAPDGLSGNEDCGQMSSWYVLSALGFYPVNPAGGVFVIGTPGLKQARMQLPNDKTLEITTEGLSDTHFYVQQVTRDGEPLKKSWMSYEEVLKGGQLHFVMGAAPNKNWASAPAQCPPDAISW